MMAFKHDEISYSANTINFIENGKVPNDTEITGYTWKYVNKNGSPDNRFSDNAQLPKCRYGELHIYALDGFNTTILVSNPNLLEDF